MEDEGREGEIVWRVGGCCGGRDFWCVQDVFSLVGIVLGFWRGFDAGDTRRRKRGKDHLDVLRSNAKAVH